MEVIRLVGQLSWSIGKTDQGGRLWILRPPSGAIDLAIQPPRMRPIVLASLRRSTGMRLVSTR